MHLRGGQEPGVPAPEEGRTSYEVGEGGAEEGEAGEDAEDVNEGEPGAGAFVFGVRGASLGQFVLLVLLLLLIIATLLWVFGRLATTSGVGVGHWVG